MSRYDNHQLVFLDTETGGFQVDQNLLEFACVATDITSREVREEWSVKVLPEFPERLTARAAMVNGYDEEVWQEEAVPLSEAVRRMAETIDGRPSILVGHNVSFDWRFIADAAMRSKWQCSSVEGLIDTLWMAKQLPGVEKHNLESLCTEFGLAPPAYHRALEDTRTCRLVYQELRRRGVKPRLSAVEQWWAGRAIA